MRAIGIVWLSRTDLTNLNAGEGEANFIDLKKYKVDGEEYPYVSGQAMRHYLRESIRRNLNSNEYMCVPNDKGETCGDIKRCIGCDLFGFMTTIKGKGAVTRVSPVKVSPAVGLFPFEDNSVVDFLTRKHRMEKGEMEGDIVNVEIGVNLYKCGIAIDALRVGGEEKITENRTVEIEYYIDANERKNRIAKVLEALRYLSDYSKQARLLTDFTPDVILISFQNKYSHRLQKAFKLNGKSIDIQRLENILDDVGEYSSKIFGGILSGTIDNEEKVKATLKSKGIEVTTPNNALENAIEYLKKVKIE